MSDPVVLGSGSPPPLLAPPPPPGPPVLVVPVAGPAGPPGEQGPTGPKGDPGGVYVHVQAEPSDTWIVDHGLQRRPVAWSLYDDQDRERWSYVVEHPTVNRVIVRMDVATTGTFTVKS